MKEVESSDPTQTGPVSKLLCATFDQSSAAGDVLVVEEWLPETEAPTLVL